MRVEVVASTLAGAPRSPSPHRTRTAGYPNQRTHPCAHRQHARTLTHSTDRNDAPGLADLARTGFFKPVHMKSPSAHALRSLIIARKKTGGLASDLGESDPRFGGRVREHNPSIPVARCAQNNGHSLQASPARLGPDLVNVEARRSLHARPWNTPRGFQDGRFGASQLKPSQKPIAMKP